MRKGCCLQACLVSLLAPLILLGPGFLTRVSGLQQGTFTFLKGMAGDEIIIYPGLLRLCVLFSMVT